MAKKLHKGWIIEEQVAGIDRWFRTNGWIYSDAGSALDYAERRTHHPDVRAVRVLSMEHTSPAVAHELG